MERPTTFEAWLRSDQRVAVGALFGLSLACWAWLGPAARDMYGTMQGPSAWMMTARWDGPFTLMMAAMWIAMMAAMMLPSAVPALLLFGSIARRDGRAMAAERVYLFAAGYLVVWAGYGAALAMVQRELSVHALMSPMMEVRGRLAGLVLVLAGVHQLTPLKRACLRACQSPARFIAHYWRTGRRGAFSIGLKHGGYCVGCCWALMLLLFAAGVMNLTALLGLTIFVAFEKVAPRWARSEWLSGVALLSFGVWTLVRAAR